MKFLMALMAIVALTFNSNAEDGNKKEAQIQTNAQCGECKERIENKLNYTKGIKFAEMDLTTKIVTVSYNSKKITLDEIKKVISEIGYSADDVEPVKAAQQALPKCCQPGGH
ncbi:heavy-metal-associated domain-containing protein [Lishizhenia sp.]|uniref:heavy-metal-associated domain-containing protein n=1 Tax=Lishizhenia sp. TaxID=2497594 RepID=UPI00299F0C52|nr:heavy-metal-associated domain-containing protein [Lishizhenia sp.]MDX1446249.1 heavy-metal-associated domain-containing protein [Lishizhenia sp.]